MQSQVQCLHGACHERRARVLHALRWLIGDDAFFQTLRRLVYPDDAAAATTDGSAVRFAGTNDIIAVAERESGRELGWFFDVYVFQPVLPALVSAQIGDQLTLEWETPGALPFPLPIEVRINGQAHRVEMTDGRGAVRIPAGAEVAIDPDDWVLRAR